MSEPENTQHAGSSTIKSGFGLTGEKGKQPEASPTWIEYI